VLDEKLVPLPPADGDWWDPPPEFDGYQIKGAIGKGSMGAVYTAEETALGRMVAIKFTGTGFHVSQQEGAEFLLEARTLAQLQHSNVVAIYRVGEVDGHPYIAYELLRGRSLDELRARSRREILEIGIGLARGLAAVHERNIIHRDIKPTNAIFTNNGEVKLLDFGLAKFVSDAKESPDAESAPSTEDPDANRTPGEFDPHKTLKLQISSSGKVLTDLADARRGQSVGTPRYMAPEVWRGEPATFRSDVYSFGAVMYRLYAGHPPHTAKGMEALEQEVLKNDAPRLNAETNLDEELSAIIHRCLNRDPARRFPSAVELRDALEAATPERRATALPEGNPYRSLQPFEASHRALFFGRRREIRAVIDRLREDPMVLVLGISGVGKSSLCRAGVLPWVADFGVPLLDDRPWTTVMMTPGRRPVLALAEALSRQVEGGAQRLEYEIRLHWEWLYSNQLGPGLGGRGPLLIFIDQLEELATLSDPEEAAVIAKVLQTFVERPQPGVRLVATLRADFLARLAYLPRMPDGITRYSYVLKPMSREGIREAIVGPANATGVDFESLTLVETLVRGTLEAEGALPLLQFTLAELWEKRHRNVISASALDATGGVLGGLARHADWVLSGLATEQRTSARRILPLLVTLQETRIRQTEDELGVRTEADREALNALVRGRLVTASESPEGPIYEVAHEALISAWPTLRRWLQEDDERRKLRDRLFTAIAEWDRLGRKREALWSARQLAEVDALLKPSELPERERTFLRTSHQAIRLKRRLLAAAAAVSVLATVGTYFGVSWKARHDRTAHVESLVNAAASQLSKARSKNGETEQLRRQAFWLFDNKQVEKGEEVWLQVGKSAKEADQLYGEVGRSLEAAVALGRDSTTAKALLADALYDRALIAERDGRSEALEELLARLGLYDDGSRKAKWQAPAKLHLESTPSGADVTIQEYRAKEAGNPELVLWGPRVRTPVERLELPPGSYLLTLQAEGATTVRLPLLLGRGESRSFDLKLPSESTIPKGFVYIPPGPFLFGSSQETNIRQDDRNTVPVHEVVTGGYLIAVHETTFGDWLDYLNSLSKPERLKRASAVAGSAKNSLSLRPIGQDWELRMQRGSGHDVMRMGDALRISERKTGQDQHWPLLPVVGVSTVEIDDYLSWLRGSFGSIHPRLCTELEWEKAARGADGREYPEGNSLSEMDANYFDTYGSTTRTASLDEVGTHTASRSPFEIDDMAGNAAEFTLSVFDDLKFVLRGGSFLDGRNQVRGTHRRIVPDTYRGIGTGFRLCADLK